jgi:hypothetical protein
MSKVSDSGAPSKTQPQAQTRTKEQTLAAAPTAGVVVQSIEVRTPEDYTAAFTAMTENRVRCPFSFWQSGQLPVPTAYRGLCLEAPPPEPLRRTPLRRVGRSVVVRAEFHRPVPTRRNLCRQNPQGSQGGCLPVEQPIKIELVINLTTAKLLGLAIPQSMRDRGFEEII